MKSKRKEIPKYNVGGFLQAGMGLAQTAYGLSQLPAARAELQRAQAAAPSLETPSQYYENYKNAYDSELARMQDDMIQRNLATSVEALQGAGGRALVGGLSNAVSQGQAAQIQMLAQERAARMQAGQQLAGAQERAIARKESRSQTQMSNANKVYQSALGNVGAGVGAIGTGLMYGLKDINLKGAVDNENPISEVATDKPFNIADYPVDNFDVPLPPELQTGSEPVVDQKLVEQSQANVDNPMMEEAAADQWYENRFDKSSKPFQMADYPVDENTNLYPNAYDPRLDNSVPNGTAYSISVNDASLIQKSDFISVDESGKPSFVYTPESQAALNRRRKLDVMANSYLRDDRIWASKQPPLTPREAEIVSAYNAYNNALRRWEEKQPKGPSLNERTLTSGGMQNTVTFLKEKGGMMTNGDFSHSKNPIDIVQNGVKIGEATGGEYILNPTQAKKVAQQSSYAKRLFKSFERKAKKNK